MTNAEDVLINGLNEYLNHKDGKYILQKSSVSNSTFKSYITCTYTLWFVNKGIKHNVFSFYNSDNKIERLKSKMLKDLSINIFKFLSSLTLDIIKNGDTNK